LFFAPPAHFAGGQLDCAWFIASGKFQQRQLPPQEASPSIRPLRLLRHCSSQDFAALDGGGDIFHLFNHPVAAEAHYQIVLGPHSDCCSMATPKPMRGLDQIHVASLKPMTGADPTAIVGQKTPDCIHYGPTLVNEVPGAPGSPPRLTYHDSFFAALWDIPEQLLSPEKSSFYLPSSADSTAQ